MASCGRVVVLGDGEGEVKVLHVSFFACVRLFKRTEFVGACMHKLFLWVAYTKVLQKEKE